MPFLKTQTAVILTNDLSWKVVDYIIQRIEQFPKAQFQGSKAQSESELAVNDSLRFFYKLTVR